MKKAMFLTPVVTAFNKEGKLDAQANRNVWEHLIKGGIDGIVIMGSTGEFFSMSMEAKKELIDLATDYINKRVKLYIGTSCMTIEETVELSNYALEKGADAVMIIGPYYFSLSPESIEYYFDEVAKQVKGDIYLYNFPDRNGYDLTAEITLNLLRKNKNIVGFKDTVSEMGHTRRLLATVRDEFPEFVVLSGYDENLAHVMLSDGNGCIGGLSNLYPEVFAKWVKAINEKAKNIGATNSNFLRPDGYDEKGQYTTASDLACIAKYFMKNEVLSKIASKYKVDDVFVDGSKVTYENTNQLINPYSEYYYSNIKGLKTGSSSNAGKCLVSAADIDNKTYICVVMNSSDEGRWLDSLCLYQCIK